MLFPLLISSSRSVNNRNLLFNKLNFGLRKNQNFQQILSKDVSISQDPLPMIPADTDDYYKTYQNENVTYNDGYVYTDFLANYSVVTIVNCTFDTCGLSALGCISFESSSVEIFGCTFLSCYGTDGIIFASFSNVTCWNSNFSYNYADYDGGVFHCEYSTLIFSNCLFIRNQSPAEGGAMHITGCTVSIKNCLFYYNQAGHQSSALDVIFSIIEIERTSFIHNIIADIGDLEEEEIGEEDTCGVITLDECSHVVLSKCRFAQNRAGPNSDKILRIAGGTNIAIDTIYLDQADFNESIEIIEDRGDVPEISVGKVRYSSVIPRRYQRVIEEVQDYVKRVVIKCESNMTTSYLIATILVSTTLIIVILGGLAKIAGIF